MLYCFSSYEVVIALDKCSHVTENIKHEKRLGVGMACQKITQREDIKVNLY